jgi:hypothetical protein
MRGPAVWGRAAYFQVANIAPLAAVITILSRAYIIYTAVISGNENRAVQSGV